MNQLKLAGRRQLKYALDTRLLRFVFRMFVAARALVLYIIVWRVRESYYADRFGALNKYNIRCCADSSKLIPSTWGFFCVISTCILEHCL